MTIIERALRMGEGKKFKEFEKRVSLISDFEPELELDTDEELRERADALRERGRGGESLDELLPESFAPPMGLTPDTTPGPTCWSPATWKWIAS